MTRPLTRSLRLLVGIIAAIALLWVVATGMLYAAMTRPPETFGAVMTYVPPAAMAILPFKPLWMSARAGRLEVGDSAPDFTLPALHGETAITLSEQYRHQPVVLVFGSYT
jgi:hypothetical protein